MIKNQVVELLIIYLVSRVSITEQLSLVPKLESYLSGLRVNISPTNITPCICSLHVVLDQTKMTRKVCIIGGSLTGISTFILLTKLSTKLNILPVLYSNCPPIDSSIVWYLHKTGIDFLLEMGFGLRMSKVGLGLLIVLRFVQ
jgi:hypothetical protein